MKYKERYREEHKKDIRKAKIISGIVNTILFMLFVLGMVAIILGIGAIDDNTIACFVLIIAGTVVMTVTGLIMEGNDDTD